MMNFIKRNKFFCLIASFLLVLAVVVATLIPCVTARADDMPKEALPQVEHLQEEEPTPYLFATLTLSLSGEGGNVVATVKNEFTLFPSRVPVVVSLYYCSYATAELSNMMFANSYSTEDLNMGETIRTGSGTGKRQLYWYAVADYREGNGAWKRIQLGPILFDANANYIHT